MVHNHCVPCVTTTTGSGQSGSVVAGKGSRRAAEGITNDGVEGVGNGVPSLEGLRECHELPSGIQSTALARK